MKEHKASKLFTFGEERAKYFKEVAEAVVEATVISTDENKKTISYLSAVDMAIGEAVTKNKHIRTGVVIGVMGTGLAALHHNRKMKKKHEEELELAKMESFEKGYYKALKSDEDI